MGIAVVCCDTDDDNNNNNNNNNNGLNLALKPEIGEVELRAELLGHDGLPLASSGSPTG